MDKRVDKRVRRAKPRIFVLARKKIINCHLSCSHTLPRPRKVHLEHLLPNCFFAATLRLTGLRSRFFFTVDALITTDPLPAFSNGTGLRAMASSIRLATAGRVFGFFGSRASNCLPSPWCGRWLCGASGASGSVRVRGSCARPPRAKWT